jgi:hypothetical protein
MGNILSDLDSLWNAVSQAGSGAIHSIEDAVSHLASLGVPYFASLPQFIQFLVTEGENPFTFLPALVSRIISKGGEPVQVLEELAGGFLSEGPQVFTQKQATKVVNPLIATLQQHTKTANALGSLHQETVTQVKQKLTALRQSSPGSPGLQGDFALALDSNFAIVEQNMATLTGPFGTQLSDPWPVFENNFSQANQGFIWGLEQIPNMVKDFALFDLAVVTAEVLADGTIAVVTVGLGDLVAVPVEVPLDLLLVAGEIAIIGVWIIGDALIWALRVIAALIALGIEEIIYHVLPMPSQSTAGSTTLQYNWVDKKTADGTTVKVRKLTNREVSKLRTDWGTPFEQEKANEGYPANADIYVDQDGNYWIGVPGSNIVTEFP